jgi:hypothetical protein
MDVPLMVLVASLLPIQVERMFRPGAKISTHLPWLEENLYHAPHFHNLQVIPTEIVCSQASSFRSH